MSNKVKEGLFSLKMAFKKDFNMFTSFEFYTKMLNC